jgi:hypothetical protein
MKKLSFLLFFLLSINSIYAIDISFSDFGLTRQDIDIYYSNGTQLTTLISNETITLNETFDYQIVFRPQKISILDNPSIFLDYAVDFLPVLLSIVAIVLLYGVLKWGKIIK